MALNQRGSVLAGAIALSIVMSMAAGSLLIVAGNSRNDEDMAFRRAGCYLDAESGLMMGLSWLRNHTNANRADFIHNNQGWTPASKELIHAETFDNGSQVTVTVIDNALGGKTVESRAVFGAESIQFSWDVDTLVHAGSTAAAPYLKLTNWRSP